jgi:hypothetical protein
MIALIALLTFMVLARASLDSAAAEGGRALRHGA